MERRGKYPEIDHEGGRFLFAAVIGQAVKDAHGGRPCDGSCKNGAHLCRRDALRFLRSRRCTMMLTAMGVSVGEVQGELLARARGRPASLR